MVLRSRALGAPLMFKLPFFDVLNNLIHTLKAYLFKQYNLHLLLIIDLLIY